MRKRTDRLLPILLTTSVLLALAAGCSSQKSAEQGATDAAETGAPGSDKTQNQGSMKSEEVATAEASMGPQGPEVLIGKRARGKAIPGRVGAPTGEASALLVAIDTPYQIFDNQGTYVHVAAWHVDGKPAKSARVHVGEFQVGETDEHGSLVFLYPPKGSGGKSALGANMVTVVDTQDENLQGSVGFSPNIRTASFASDHLFVYTDRGVYKPGDTISVRAIGWHLKEDYQPLLEADVEFILKDGSGRVVGGAKRTTDEFGISSMQIPLPGTASEGLYTLEVAYKQERQSARLQVREYKPPTVQIEHDLARFITRDQKKLATDVTLRPSAGGTFKAGELELAANYAGTTLFSMKRSVKGNGPHRFEVSDADLAKIKAKAGENSWVKFKLRVRDSIGREDELVREMRFTSNPYVAVIELDKDQYSTGDAVEVVAKIRDLDGVPLREKKVTLDVAGVQMEAKTDGSGTAQFSLEMPASTTTVKLYIDGVKTPIATQILRWVAPRAMVSHIAQPIIKERQTAKVTVKFPTDIVPAEEVVHMDVVDTSGAIVNAVLLEIKETPDGYIASGEFDSPTWGSMLLTFFALGKRKGASADPGKPHYSIGLLTEGQNLVVHPNRELEIVLDGVPDKATPGQELAIQAKIKDANGNLTRASVGAAVVDGRVISLKDPLEITPMDHFYEPTLRTMSTTGSKILSWPVVSRNWGGRIHDIALPPFPYLEGGRVSDLRPRTTATLDSVDEDAPSPPGEPEPEAEEMMDGLSGSSSSSGYGSGKGAMAPKKVKISASKIMLGGAGEGGGGMSSNGIGGLADKSKESERRSRDSRGGAPARPVTITIRTSFEETSFWQPHMRADGETTFKAKLPDSIAEQELIVVASDSRGGVGVTRKMVSVEQPLYARADFPKFLRAGERVMIPLEIRNNTGKEETFDLSFQADGLKAGFDNARVVIPSGSAGGAMIEVTALTQGELPYKIVVSGAGRTDIVEGSVDVEPAGLAMTATSSGSAGKGSSFKKKWTVPADALGNEATLSVALPSVTTAMVGVEHFESTVRDAPLTITADLATAALLLQYAQRRGLDSGAIADLRKRVMMAVGALQFSQHPNGSYSYWRNATPSVYVTAWALEGLVEAQQLDMAVPQETIVKSAEWLARQVDAGGLVEVDSIAFWEGDSEKVRLGITAEVFHVLASMPKSTRTPIIEKTLEKLATSYGKYLEQPTLDPLAAGRALQAMTKLGKVETTAAKSIITRLLSARDDRHWEPSWFHAYAGRVDTTTAMIELMVTVDATGYRAEIRDALQWVLSTRESWGAWHSERATAAAARALMAAGLDDKDYSGKLEVYLDGKKVREYKIDGKDPFISALELNHLSLGRALSAGEHEVEVRFDGAPVSVIHTARTWPKRALSTSATAGGYKLTTQAAKSKLMIGQDTSLGIDAELPATREVTRITVSPSGLLDVQTGELARLAEENKEITNWSMNEDGLTLWVKPGKARSLSLALPVSATRPGEGAFPTVAIEQNGEALVAASAGKVTTSL
ncbi:MAG: MG2 domain-containing protein [Myxococcota bacterium]|nr:MG2 domain-containing protein [Myxococcota bacterium]